MAARALATAPARAAEPGSTHRAQASRQAAKTGVPRSGTANSARGASSAVVNVASSLFEPPQAIAEEIEKAGPRGLDVRVIAKGLTEEGLIKVRQNGGKTFDSIGLGTMPLLNPWTKELGGMYLNFEIDNSAIKSGYASFKSRGGARNDWLQSLKKNAALLGGLGLNVESLPQPVNKFEQGKLVLGVAGMKVVVGGYVDATFDLLLENMEAPKINGSAVIDIKGAVKGTLAFDNPGNVLRGSVSLAVNFKAFSGAVKVAYLSDGTVDISGSAGYSGNKLSGEIQFVATDLDTANKFAKDALAAAGGKENVQNAGPPSPVPAPKEGKRKLALAATGRLSFNLTTWFAGTVQVVVDGKGDITVIGKIAPPGEILLFAERPWTKELVKFEAKAYYGIPVVGNLNLFANISLVAIAKLGPAKLREIEILGTYSTDPKIQKNIQISGSLNISAYGGLRLGAQGGAGIEILAHDLKFGIGLNADVGVKAYADARPTIGYRDPGVFYVSGTLDLVAQPILGLGGEFFIELDAPWFSPLSDDRWSWPLFSKEWPLGDPIGISATLKDYVLGSGKVPEIELKAPEFDPSKFMTNMVDDKLPKKSGGTGAGDGTFKEDGSVPKPDVKSKKTGKSGSAEGSKKKKVASPGLGKSSKLDTKAANDAKSTAILKNAAKPLTDLKGRGPLTRGSLDQELAKIRKQVSGINFGVKSNGAKWVISPKAGGMAGKGLEIGAKSEAGGGGWWRVRKPVSGGGQRHTVQFAGDGENARLMVQTRLVTWEDFVAPIIPFPGPGGAAAKAAAITAAQRLKATMRLPSSPAKAEAVERDLNALTVAVGELLRLSPPPGNPLLPTGANAYPGSGIHPNTRTLAQLWTDILPAPLRGTPPETPRDIEFRRVMARGVLLTKYGGGKKAIAQAMIDHNLGREVKAFNLTANEAGPGAHTVKRHVLNGSGEIWDMRDLALRALLNDPPTGGNPASAFRSVTGANTAIRAGIAAHMGAAGGWAAFRERIINTTGNVNATPGDVAAGAAGAALISGGAFTIPTLPAYVAVRPFMNTSLAAAAGNRQLYPGDRNPGLIPPPMTATAPLSGNVTIVIRTNPGVTGGWYVYTSWPK